MNVAVIGATGCGGRAVVAGLRAAGHIVCGLARGRTPGPAPDLVCDRQDADALRAALRRLRPDVVVDQIAGTAEQVRATLDACPAPVRYVLVSSAGVYGADREAPCAEDTPVDPTPGLMAAKWAAEQALEDRPGHTCLRLGALYGPGHAPMTPWGRRPTLAAALAAGEPIVVPADDPPALQPLFADDLGRVVAAVLADPEPPECLNVAGRQTLRWADWLAAWARAFGTPPPVLRPLAPDDFAAAAPEQLRPFLAALSRPPRMNLARLRARYRHLGFWSIHDGTRQVVRELPTQGP